MEQAKIQQIVETVHYLRMDKLKAANETKPGKPYAIIEYSALSEEKKQDLKETVELVEKALLTLDLVIVPQSAIQAAQPAETEQVVRPKLKQFLRDWVTSKVKQPIETKKVWPLFPWEELAAQILNKFPLRDPGNQPKPE